MDRIVPIPFQFTWGTFLRCLKLIWVTHVTLSLDEHRVTWPNVMALMSASTTVLVLLEDTLIHPRGFSQPFSVHLLCVLVNLAVYVWQVRFLFFSTTNVVIPFRLLLLHKGMCTIMSHIIVMTFGVLPLLKFFGFNSLADQLEAFFFNPEPVLVDDVLTPIIASSTAPASFSSMYVDLHPLISDFLFDREQAAYLRVCRSTHVSAGRVSWREVYRHDRQPARGRVLRLHVEGNPLPQSIIFPVHLERLTFGGDFNQPLVGVQFPSSLQQLTLGDNFNHPLVGVQFPESLQQLTLGRNFNQSLVGVQFPESLRQLTLGWDFNQSLVGVQFHESLQQLTLSGRFDHPLVGVQFPESLQRLTLGHWFDQPLLDVHFPSSLQQLTLGDHFNHSLVGVQFPSSLQKLTLGWNFNHSLAGVQFPESLQQLTLGRNFNQSLVGVQFPESLRQLTLGWDFNQSLVGVQFPSSLQKLKLSYYFIQYFIQSLLGVRRCSSYYFNQSLEGVQFPASLHLDIDNQ